jgi:inner membrane protein
MPDLDVLAAPLHGGYGEWLYHRGTTHSLWFGFVAGPAIAWLLWRWRDPKRHTPYRAWAWLAILALVTHPILDGFTPYGTQLFAPFWRERFAWNGVAIVDPLYTIPLAIGVAMAASRRFGTGVACRPLVVSLGVTTAYLFAGVGLNLYAEERVRHALHEEGWQVERVRVYPTVLQPWARHFVARTDAGLLLGWYSATQPDCPVWQIRETPAQSARIDTLLQTWEGKLLAWFADGEIGFAEQSTPSGVVVRMDDLRYTWGSSSSLGTSVCGVSWPTSIATTGWSAGWSASVGEGPGPASARRCSLQSGGGCPAGRTGSWRARAAPPPKRRASWRAMAAPFQTLPERPGGWAQPCIVRPPETLIVWPVMKAASSESRKAIRPG